MNFNIGIKQIPKEKSLKIENENIKQLKCPGFYEISLQALWVSVIL